MTDLWPWVTLALLGAYHGINPAMGWLFAVALGMQEKSRERVVRALGPIAIGHALSIAVVAALLSAVQLIVSDNVIRLAAAGILVAFGIFKLLASNTHPRWVGMRVGAGELTLWSFLMSTAHGAGLMLLPMLLRMSPSAMHSDMGGEHAGHVASAAGGSASLIPQLSAVAVHSGAMLLVMGLVAIVIYEKVGLAILRRAWLNLDRVWAGALLIAGFVTFAI